MLKILIVVFLSAGVLSANAPHIKEGWNMLGVTQNSSSADFISNSGEYIYSYNLGQWRLCHTNQNCTLYAGEAFWLFATNSRSAREMVPSGDFVNWQSGSWSFVTPTVSPWYFDEAFPTVELAWRYDDGWMVYSDVEQNEFERFDSVGVGEGVWVKSTHNGFIGSSAVNITNGDFGTLTKRAQTIYSKDLLKAEAKNTYDMRFDLVETLPQEFSMVLKIVKNNSSTVHIRINVNSQWPLENPYISVKSSTASASGIVIDKNFLQTNSTKNL